METGASADFEALKRKSEEHLRLMIESEDYAISVKVMRDYTKKIQS
jgi:hypothetical protein